ncbi:sulfur carrier protein ThiS [Sporolactobacillus sp. THM7-7]|nr:sulfur carrier protein ThiS [Sporolactobacillus sp. THM7-7]
MTVVLNGQSLDLPDYVRTIGSLLTHFHLEKKMIVIEKNGRIVEKPRYAEESVKGGDRIEIVHFVGGG